MQTEATERIIGYYSDGEHDEEDALCRLIRKSSPETWVPLTIFPRFSYEKKGKMDLAFEPLNLSESQLEHYRLKVRRYLRKLDINQVFIPPPELVLKVDSARYNDGGVVRRDYERVQTSFDSGFKYQIFNPKPLASREVWLPDRSTKINNAFWMIVSRQILEKDKRYPDSDPEITHERIKHRLDSTMLFDLPGYGFQYPREYLYVMAEEITRLFPNPDIFENLTILSRIFDSVKVEMPDGTFKYPVRGIGLGYYEDLKTLGILAILDNHDIISLYGDQGLIGPLKAHQAIEELRYFGFLAEEPRYEYHMHGIKWQGWYMNHQVARRPKQLLEPLIAAFQGQYHWERKNIIRTFYEEFPDFYNSIDKILPFQYELAFGYEFQKCDSLWNFRNGGISSVTPRNVGCIKGWAAERLQTPRDSIVDSVIYETPFFTEWKRGDAKKFSMLRKTTYKQSRHANVELVDYVNPCIMLHKTKKPVLSDLARLVSDAIETKLIVNHRLTTGKFLYGLNSTQSYHALRYCSLARNPYEAYSTGGYQVETLWHRIPYPTSEHVDLLEHMLTNVDFMSNHIATRFDIDAYEMSNIFPHYDSKKRAIEDVEESTVVSPVPSKKSRYRKIKFQEILQLNNNPKPLNREDRMPQEVVGLLGDMSARSNVHLVDVSDSEDNAELDDEFFGAQFEDLESASEAGASEPSSHYEELEFDDNWD